MFQQENQQSRIRINHYIRVPQIRLILEDGTNYGVIATKEALKMAQDAGNDLVEINPKASPPVCKIINYGKFLYEEKKKNAELKKKQKVQETKELTFRPSTDINDLNHKLIQAKSFLNEGNKVKFSIKFKGREISHPNIAREKMNFIIEELKDLIDPNPQISLEGKFMWMIVSPIKK